MTGTHPPAGRVGPQHAPHGINNEDVNTMMMNCGQEKNRLKSSLYGIDLQRQGLRQKQLSLQIEELALDGTSVIHFNQRLAGQEILTVFSDHPDLLMVLGIGLTQSGKTGVMSSWI